MKNFSLLALSWTAAAKHVMLNPPIFLKISASLCSFLFNIVCFDRVHQCLMDITITTSLLLESFAESSKQRLIADFAPNYTLYIHMT